MLLFPPWLYFDSNTSNQRSAGYHIFFNRPRVTSYEEMFGMPADEVLTTRFVRVSLNGIRLVTQLVFVIFLTIGMVLRFGQPRSWSHRLYSAVALLAGVFLVLLLTVKF